MRPKALIALIVVATLVGAVGVLYAFGTPQAPLPLPASGGGSDASYDGDAAVTDAEVPAPDPRSPLAIQIPGCVCHSDDPKLVEEHASYRMNQCAGCHAGKTPTGQ